MENNVDVGKSFDKAGKNEIIYSAGKSWTFRKVLFGKVMQIALGIKKDENGC